MEKYVCRKFDHMFFLNTSVYIVLTFFRWCGALLAAIGLQLVLLIFPWYVHEFMANYVGQLGIIIIILLLFYLFGLLFVIGAQINAFFFDCLQPLPFGLGTCLSEFADRELIPLTDEPFRPHDLLVEQLNSNQEQQQQK